MLSKIQRRRVSARDFHGGDALAVDVDESLVVVVLEAVAAIDVGGVDDVAVVLVIQEHGSGALGGVDDQIALAGGEPRGAFGDGATGITGTAGAASFATVLFRHVVAQ